MTAFLALMRKDLLLFFADRRALLINLVLPIVIATFFGYLFGGSGKTESGRIAVALVHSDTSETTRKIVAGLKADPSLEVVDMTLEQARKEVGKGRRKAAIVIPAGFGDAAGTALFGAGSKPTIAVLYDPSQQAVLSMVKGMLTQQVMQVVTAEIFNRKAGPAVPGKTPPALEEQSNPDRVAPVAGAASATGGTGGMSMPFATSDEAVTSGPREHGYNAYAHAFAGMGVQFILFLGIDIGIGILLARRSGIFNRLLAAPVSLRTVLLSRAVSAAVIALFLLCFMFAFAIAVLGVKIANPLGFAGVAVAFALLTASFGLFIAAFGRTPEAARGIAVFATLIMVMLGGAWVPAFMFPAWVQTAAMAVPTKWAIDGFDAMTWRGQGMDAALTAIGAQLAFTAVFAVLALWKFKREQRG